ncbi:MAG: TRAP transporter small permease [Bacillota bacterium]|jgi:TRAP-type C4-dicarboxylate transport system permease small subunit
MKRVLNIINNKLEEYFLIVTMAAMVLIIFLQIIMRYVFNNSLTWSEEITRYIFLWQIWVGVSYAVKSSKHIRVEIIKDFLTPRGKFIIDILATLIWLTFGVFLFYRAGIVTSKVYVSGQLAPATQISMWIPYASVFVGSGLMIFRLLQKMYYDIKTPVFKEGEN